MMTPEQLTKVNEYFSDIMEFEAFALHVRRLMYVTTRLHLQEENKSYEDWINNGTFWLNDFVETIDPYLEKEENPAKPNNWRQAFD